MFKLRPAKLWQLVRVVLVGDGEGGSALNHLSATFSMNLEAGFGHVELFCFPVNGGGGGAGSVNRGKLFREPTFGYCFLVDVGA